MALINVTINFVYEYFSFVIYFSKIFLSKLFSKHFFPTSFQNLFFEGFTLDALPFTETKRTMNLCYKKYDIQANIAG